MPQIWPPAGPRAVAWDSRPPHLLDHHDKRFGSYPAVRQQLRPAARALLRPRAADAGRGAPAASSSTARSPASSASIPTRWRRPKASRSSPATAFPRAPSRSRPPMPATSSAASSPQLGDGRAILLGEVVDRDGMRRDIQLKGSGPTPFSRRGDGRAALGPVLREYLVSEAMAALGIPTTRALAAVTTGEPVLRETDAARRRADPRRVQPHPRRHLPVLRRPRRRRGAAAARRPRHRAPLPRGAHGAGSPIARSSSGSIAAPGRARRAVAAGRLHPRRDEHRQHLDRRRDDRLRPLRLHGRLRSRPRSSARSTSTAAMPMPTSRASRHGTWRGSPRRLLPLLADDSDAAVAEANEALRHLRRRASQPRYPAGLRRKLGLLHRAGGRCRAGAATCSTRWPRTRPTSRSPSGGSAMPRPMPARRCRCARALRRSRRLRCLGGALARSGSAGSRRTARRARRDAGREPRLHPAQPPRRGGASAPPIERRRFRAVRGAADGAGAALRRSAGLRRLRGAAEGHERGYQTFCGT